MTYIISGIDGVGKTLHNQKVGCSVEQSVCLEILQTIYIRINMCQKCEGNCGLWVLNEMIKKIYPENLKKIVGAVWELPAK